MAHEACEPIYLTEEPAIPFIVLHSYTGASTLEEALASPRAGRLLWLEILLNEQIEAWLDMTRPDIQEAYDKAYRWYTSYQTLIQQIRPRTPLPTRSGPLDPRDQRTFLEALRFVASDD